MSATPTGPGPRGSSSEKVFVAMARGPNNRYTLRTVDAQSPLKPGPRTPTPTPRAPTTPTPTSREDGFTDSGTKSPVTAVDLTPSCPRGGERPNELLQRLYSLWPAQLTASYRPHAAGNPEASADFNLRYIRELYPRRRGRRRAKAAGMMVGAVMHMDRKAHYSVNLATWPRH